MATLQIKNKYEVTFIRLVKETHTDGGIPDVIQVNGREAWDILNEIKAIGNKAFVVTPTDDYDPKFVLKRGDEKIDHDTAEELVTKWWKKQFSVTFKDGKNEIPIIVVPDPKKDVQRRSTPVPPEPKPPQNETMSEWELPENVEPLKKPTDKKDDSDDEEV